VAKASASFKGDLVDYQLTVTKVFIIFINYILLYFCFVFIAQNLTLFFFFFPC